MSRERCISLDRANRQRQNVVQCGGYLPERSPHRSPLKLVSPHYSPSTPEVLRDSFPGCLSNSLDDFDICPTPKRVPRPLELQQEHALEHQRLHSPPKFPPPQDLPDEYLEDFAQPSFYEPPANSSFDELMCVLATPPSRRQAPPVHQLSPKALGREVECPQKTDHRASTEIASSPTLCRYKIPPLPDDPYDIPPHPKDSKDVVGFIRRSRAIHRLKALQEAEETKKLPKGVVKRGVSGTVPGKKLPPAVPIRLQVRKGIPQPQKPKAVVGKGIPQPQKPKAPVGKAIPQPQKPKAPVGKGIPQRQQPKTAVKTKKFGPCPPEHPPNYIAPEYAATLLRARQLAGLKTRPLKLLPTSKIAPPSQPKAAVLPAPLSRIPPPRAYASVAERDAAIRAKSKAVRAGLLRQQESDVCPVTRPQYVDNTDQQPQILRPPHLREAAAEAEKEWTAEANEEWKADADRIAEEEHDAYLELEQQAHDIEIAEAKKKLIAEAKKKRAAEERERRAAKAKKRRAVKHDRKNEEELDAYLVLERQAHEEEKRVQREKALRKELEECDESQMHPEVVGNEYKSTDCFSNFSPNKFEALQQVLSATYARSKLLDPENPQSAAEQNYIADQISLLGSTKPQSGTEAGDEEARKYIQDIERMLLNETPSAGRPSNVSPKKFQALEEKLSATCTVVNPLDPGKPRSVAEQHYIANQIRLMGSAERKSVVEASNEETCKRIKELEKMLSDKSPKNIKKALAANIMQHDESSVSPRVTHQTETTSSPIFEMPPVIRFFELMRRREAVAAESCTELGTEECVLPEYASDPKQFQDIADWNLANISGTSDVCPPLSAKSRRSPARVMARRTSPARICHSSIDENLIEAVDIPDVGTPAFLTEANVDFGEDIDLGDITMPEDGFDEDMTLKELGLEDISSPELDDMSISMLEGYDPDYALELTDKSHDKDLESIQEQQTSPGFLTTVVSAVVDKFRNIFGGTPRDVEEDDDEPSHCINLDSTLPNMFTTTPLPRKTSTALEPTVGEEPFTIPKYPKEYMAMVKKSQLIYKQKAMEAAEAARASQGRKKPVVRGTIPRRVQPPGGRGKPGYQKKQEPPAKIYPPGEYSPSYAADVARARTLAGYKNRSAILNPERAAKIAAIKAEKEAELAAEEALPPVERMRKRIARLNQKGSRLCPRPSIETLGTIEAIRANLPRPRIASLPKAKWQPVTRRRADKSIEEEERVFTKSPLRVFEQFKPMSPLNEESYNEEDLIRFSPLRAREGKLRLKHLKEQAERRDRDVLHTIQHTDSSTVEHLCTPEAAPVKYSPIRLQSPSRPRTKELEKHEETTAQIDNRGEQSIREEVTKTSTIENGDVHTTTRKVTTKTDEFGNVTCRIEENTGLIGEEDATPDSIDAIEAPEFLHISDIESPRDPSIPTPSQIIDRMRKQVHQKLNLVLPQISADIESSAGQSFGLLEFPEDLPDEQLCDIDIPELETTPQHLLSEPRERSPDTSLPYFWDEEKQPGTSPSSVPCPSTPVTQTSSDHASPSPKREPVEGSVVIPPFPKDPKDYVGMVKYARAIHKRKQQQEAAAAARSPAPVAVKKKPVRVPISRRIGKAGKHLLPKNKPKKVETPKIEDDDIEFATEPPPLPFGYAEEVARARELAGFKNRTAALNPKVAAKLAAIKAAKEAALAEYEALPEYQKILRRMEKLRRNPPQKCLIQPTADVLGTLEGKRANMLPIDEALQPNASPMRQTPICKTALCISVTPKQLPYGKIMDAKGHESQSARTPDLSHDEFLAFEEECRYEVPGKHLDEHSRNQHTADVLGTLEGKRANMLPIDEALQPNASPMHQTPICKTALCISVTPKQLPYGKIMDAKGHESQSARTPDLSHDEFLAFEEECRYEVPGKQMDEHSRNQPTADVLGTLEGKRANMLPIDEALQPNASPMRQTPICKTAVCISVTPKQLPYGKIMDAKGHESQSARTPDLSHDEFLAFEEECRYEVPGKQTDEHSRNLPRGEFVNLDECKDYAETPQNLKKARPRNIMQEYIAQKGEGMVCPNSAQTKPPSYNQEYYQELIADFCPASKDFGRAGEVAFGELAPQTAVDPKERLRRIKANQTIPCPVRELDTGADAFISPSVEYSPIRLFTPTGKPRSLTPRDISPVQASKKNVLVDLDTPKIDYRVKQFKDLEDMPFDELEFEDEPSFATTSFGKPLTPPPQPAELINKIREQVRERLRNDKPLQDQIASVSTFQFPELSQEDLFEMSDPSLAHTILGDTPTIQESAQSPKSSPARMKSPVRTPTAKPTIQQAPEVEEEMCQPKYPKGYVEMVMKARAMHKLKQQQQAEMAAAPPPSEPTKKSGRVTTTKPGGKVVMKKGLVRPPKVIKKKETQPLIEAHDEIECPTEAPPLPPEYLADVARARQLAGYKNRTAALNPQVAAEEAAYAALTEHEKIKVRMDRLRKKSGHRQRPKPSMDQLAFIQAMKETCTYESPTQYPSPSTVKSCTPQQRLPITPRCNRSADAESPGMAEFLAIEQQEQGFVENPPELCDAVFDQVEREAVDAQLQTIANAQQQQLATPRERYKRLLTQVQPAHKTPVPSTPVQTPDICFSPIQFAPSPTTTQRAEKSTTQITKSGDNTIKEQVIETSEIVDGQLQQVTKVVTTTTDSSGNVTRQINESRQLSAKDKSAAEDELAGIEQPSFLDITPMSPIDVPRPRDIIERIQRDVKNKPRPNVPTGQLIDLRTPPRVLALPQNVTEEELLDMSCPALPKTPTKSPMQSPRRSPVRSQDVSIPELFAATPEPPTPPLPPVSPLRHRVHSPEGPIVIPPCPKDPTDYKGMVRMSRKIYELKLQKEAKAKAAAEAAAIEASKPKKKERVPISRWTAPPPRKEATRKKLVMRKRVPVEQQLSAVEPVRECPTEPPPLPEGYAEEVARARYLAGLRNLTAALNPKVAAREGAPASYETLISRMASMRKVGHMPKVEPSLQAAAYLNAVKGAMATRQSTGEAESAETRYKKILAARAHSPPRAAEELSMETTPLPEDVQYTPVAFGSPTAEYVDDINFDLLGLQDIGDLVEIEEPSFLEETGRYIPRSPNTPSPTPSAIIRRIREQVQEKLAAEKLAYPMSLESPTYLPFPEDLPEEELFELSAPSFARTPQSQSPTQVCTPNVSIPRYFEATPQSKLPTPMSLSTKRPDSVKEHASESPPLMGIHRGLRVVTPEGPLVLPPHPKGRESAVDMIRRAQLIQKIKQKEEAAMAKVPRRTGVRVPISRRPGGPITRATKSLRPVKPKEKIRKQDGAQLPVECPAEPPELPPEYIAAVARARRLAGLKNTTALLNPPQDYDTIMARVAALKMARGEIEPTAEELAEAENIIRRPERKETEEEQQTPRPAIERYRAYRSRIASETPTTSQVPYSPIKTPDLDNVPPYTPVCLDTTPHFLQNINMSDIGDISMPYDMDDGETAYELK